MQLVFISLMYSLLLVALYLGNWPPGVKILLSILIFLLFLYETSKLRLKYANSVLAVRHQAGQWQIKTRSSWLDAKLYKSVFISDWLLILHFKHKNKKFCTSISHDVLDAISFKDLRTKVRLDA